jgi:hypothetical protein
MSKNSESSFATRLADITGSNISKIANLAEAHKAPEQGVTKLASMSVGEMLEHDAFVGGFESRLAERIGELDAAVIRLMV